MISVWLGGSVGDSHGTFDGPLDLLLALVRQNRYPLDRLPLADITRQYSAYLRDAAQCDVEIGGEFIETASWLVLLKSRTLLPQSPQQEAPEQELRRVLLDHSALKKAADLLRERMEESGLGSGAGPSRATIAPQEHSPAPASAPPTVQDAVVAALRAQAVAAPAVKSYPIEAEVDRILADLASLPPGRAASTESWFAARLDPEAHVALFPAVIELAHLSLVLLGQRERFGPNYMKHAARDP